MAYNILITGAHSYIGTHFKNYVSELDDFIVDELDVHDDNWKDYDFSKYDSVFHVAAIVHRDNKNGNWTDLYYKVNRDLAVDIATKAKSQGVSQFIFMSTAAVYGDELNVITDSTPLNPSNHYGKSKLDAERLISELQGDDFSVAIVRPPMIYGPATKGNYPRLSRLAQKIIFFPKEKNQRSMLFIDNLCEFIRLVICHRKKGIFHPQNTKYVNTSELVKDIAAIHDRKLFLIHGFEKLFLFFASKNSTFRKLFGNFMYHEDLSAYPHEYNKVSYKDSIRKSELPQKASHDL